MTLLLCAGLLRWWGSSPTQASGPAEFRGLDLGAATAPGEVAERLSEAGLSDSPFTLRLYQLVWHPLFRAEPGRHWLQVGATPQTLIEQVGRSRNRQAVRVTLPEGWDSFQMAERLASAGICDREEFTRAVLLGPDVAADAVPARRETGDGAGSYEGRLYPAAYDLRLNTAASDVVARLVAEADKRHRALFDAHRLELTRLEREVGLSASDCVTLASVVEKEAATVAEQPLVASVFLNRLRDPDFRPARMLQSDPTAAYGCKLDPSLNSCRQFTGKVTPAMLRDPANPFNTYRHAGLPPSPIGNPSTQAITAVLTAPTTEYLFFVSPDGGPHHFSRTLEEHERHLR